MRNRRRFLAITSAVSVSALLSLTACAPAEEPDLRLAEQQADDFVDAAMEENGALSVTSGKIAPRQGDGLQESGITVGFPEPVIVEGVDVACFGGGEAQLAVTVVSASSGSSTVTTPVPCDGETREANLLGPSRGVSEVTIDSWLESGAVSILATVIRGTLQ
jgi:hypothetical protein